MHRIHLPFFGGASSYCPVGLFAHFTVLEHLVQTGGCAPPSFGKTAYGAVIDHPHDMKSIVFRFYDCAIFSIFATVFGVIFQSCLPEWSSKRSCYFHNYALSLSSYTLIATVPQVPIPPIYWITDPSGRRHIWCLEGSVFSHLPGVPYVIFFTHFSFSLRQKKGGESYLSGSPGAIAFFWFYGKKAQFLHYVRTWQSFLPALEASTGLALSPHYPWNAPLQMLHIGVLPTPTHPVDASVDKLNWL